GLFSLTRLSDFLVFERAVCFLGRPTRLFLDIHNNYIISQEKIKKEGSHW
ncbi:unnamed protein product, partial [marine sediment metagenome]